MLGVSGDAFSKDWNRRFQVLNRSPLSVAVYPSGTQDGRQAWVAVSELGGPSALALRWRLILRPPDGVERVRPYAAWPIWKLEHPLIPDWARVRFALTDGLLICSVSPDPHDLYRLIDTLDGRAVSLAERRTP
jgi:hypothetical protein